MPISHCFAITSISIDHGLSVSYYPTVAKGLMASLRSFADELRSPAAREGLNAFLNKLDADLPKWAFYARLDIRYMPIRGLASEHHAFESWHSPSRFVLF